MNWLDNLWTRVRTVFEYRPEYFDREHVAGVLALHHWECVFEVDAPDRIVERLRHRTYQEWLRDIRRDPAVLREFQQCWIASEIYCPHEGIDRRKELGVTVG